MKRRQLPVERIGFGALGILAVLGLTPYDVPHKIHEILLGIVLLPLVVWEVRSAYLARKAQPQWFRWAMVYAYLR